MSALLAAWLISLAVTNGFLWWCWRDTQRDADFWYESSERWMHACIAVEPCPHESADGVDDAPLDAPAKRWRCNTCGATYTHQEAT